MSYHSGSSSADSDEVEDQFFVLIGESRERPCLQPPVDATTTAADADTNTTTTTNTTNTTKTTNTTNEHPLLAGQSTAPDNFKTIAAAIELETEALRRLLQDATVPAAPTSLDRGKRIERLEYQVKQLRNALGTAQEELVATKALNQAQASLDGRMAELIEAVNTKWTDYNSLASVVDPAKVMQDLRRANKELETRNKDLDRKGFMPKRMRELVNKVKALRASNAQLKEKLKKSEETKATADQISVAEAKLAQIFWDKNEMPPNRARSIFNLCKKLKDLEGQKGAVSDHLINDRVFELVEDFLRGELAGLEK